MVLRLLNCARSCRGYGLPNFKGTSQHFDSIKDLKVCSARNFEHVITKTVLKKIMKQVNARNLRLSRYVTGIGYLLKSKAENREYSRKSVLLERQFRVLKLNKHKSTLL
jgi:hypothetical protein